MNDLTGVMNKKIEPFEFDIKTQNQNGDQHEELTIKIKLKSKQNPNFIRILGRANINLCQLVDKKDTQTWFDIYQNKDFLS